MSRHGGRIRVVVRFVAQDDVEWQAGYAAGKQHDRRGVVGASWSWLSGWIEGDADRRAMAGARPLPAEPQRLKLR